MKIAVKQVLFSKVSVSNVNALCGNNRGQYDVRLGSDMSIGAFFSDFPQGPMTPTGGWEKMIRFADFDGENPIGADRSIHKLRYMGPSAQRKNDHYFSAQKPSTQYPLWSPGRAFDAHADVDDLQNEYILFIKDVDDHIHSRWIPAGCVSGLPAGLKMAMSERSIGIWKVENMSRAPISDKSVEIISALRQHHNVLLYGPPATGKSHLINQVRQRMQHASITVDTTSERYPLSGSVEGSLQSAWATFHQSYSYEDFLISVRPDNSGVNGFSLIPSPGILLELAEAARIGHDALLVIDEINRGNVSKIFGEFITLMEPDKRLNEDGEEGESTVAIRLPFVDDATKVSVRLPGGETTDVPNPFTMPYGVYTLATMNSVDKSVAPLDAALRRRFHVIELFPDFDTIRTSDDPDSALELGIRLLTELNERVSVFLGRDYQFGQWFLSPLMHSDPSKEHGKRLSEIWRHKIYPQLEEYFVGRSEQLLSVLGVSGTFGAVLVSVPTTEQEELGGSAVVQAKPGATTQDVLATIEHIAKS